MTIKPDLEAAVGRLAECLREANEGGRYDHCRDDGAFAENVLTADLSRVLKALEDGSLQPSASVPTVQAYAEVQAFIEAWSSMPALDRQKRWPKWTAEERQSGSVGEYWNRLWRATTANAVGMEGAARNEPNPQPTEVQALREALRGLILHVEKQTCEHDQTHRGGIIWEICDDCGAKWADDQGGKPAFDWPKPVKIARAALSPASEGGA